MNILDRARISWAVARYDFWMDVRGVPGRTRKDLRRELSANLQDAAASHGARSAILALGSPRTMAHSVAEAHAHAVRWAFGAYTALATFVLLQLSWVFSVIGFLDGVEASGVRGRAVTGSPSPWGGEATAAFGAGGESIQISAVMPLSIAVIALVVFVVTAQPWRPLTHRRADRIVPQSI